MKIFLLRHGLINNPQDVVYGRLPNFHLSAEGRQQISNVADGFIDKEISAIYASPLDRAVETANIVAEKINLAKDKIIIDERLIEGECSKWQGEPRTEFFSHVDPYKDPYRNPEMEPYGTAGLRVIGVLKEIAQKGSNAIAISHGDPIMGALSILMNDWTLAKTHYLKKGQYAVIDCSHTPWQVTLPSVNLK